MDDLYRACVTRLTEEEASLTRVAGVVDHLYAAVRRGRWAEVPGVLERLEPLLVERDRLGQATQQLAAKLVPIPGAGGPLERVARHLPPPQAATLRELKSRLRSLAIDVQRQTEATAFLARHHLAFFDDFFVELTRPAGAAPRYGPAGRIDNSPPGSLLRARG